MEQTNLIGFNELDFQPMRETVFGPDAIQAIQKFENGYGASVVRHYFSYGGKDGLYELAVLKGNDLCYDTHITNDVLGHLTGHEVTEILKQIQLLS